MLRTISQWNNLPRYVVKSQSLAVFKMRFDRLLGSLSQERLDWMIFQGPLKDGLSYDKNG